MKKLFVILLCLLLCGCAATPDSTPQQTDGSPQGGDSGQTTVVTPADFSATDEDMFTSRDLQNTYDADQCTPLTLSEGTVTLSQEGVYLLSGTWDNTMLVVDAPEDAKLQLVLDGVHITNPQGAALYIKTADKVFLTLADGSENTLTAGDSFTAVDDSNIDGAVFSRQDLTVNGTGSLEVTSPAGHGIVCKDDFVLTGGTLTVSSAFHGLDVNDSVRLGAATLNINAGKDGIHTEHDENAALGYCYLSGCTVSVEAQGDGISAGAYIQVQGGTVNILAGGGYENGSHTASDSYGGFPGGGFGGGGRPDARSGGSENTLTDSSDDSTSMKGLKAGTDMYLAGGSFTMDTADDAFHANGEMTLLDGTYGVASGDDAFHAESVLTVAGGTVTVTDCYEGLEAEKIYVTGGELELTCSDDGLNAAGGTDSSGTGGRDNMFGGGGMGMMGGVNADALISVSGGSLTIYSGGDGLDSNGNLTISGGFTTVYTPQSGDTSVLDSENAPSITGGTYIGLGISTMMAETFSASTSTQGVIACTTGGSVEADQAVTLTDSQGKVVLECTTKYSTVLLILSCPEIEKDQTYTLTVGTLSGELTAS